MHFSVSHAGLNHASVVGLFRSQTLGLGPLYGEYMAVETRSNHQRKIHHIIGELLRKVP